MRDFDERLGPLTDGLSMQISYTVLGYHVPNQTAGRDYSRAWTEHRDNS
jgi:hypothetical protein